MRILYYDCFSGISGDMNLGAMIDLGMDADHLISELSKLQMNDEFKLQIKKDAKNGITGTKADVVLQGHDHNYEHAQHVHSHGEHVHTHAEHKHTHELHDESGHTHEHTHAHQRNFNDIKLLINQSDLNDNIKNLSLKMFMNIAQAEAKVHGVTVDEVHFHEVGAVDSIVDIVGAAVALDYFKADKIMASPVQVGGGFVKCEHGLIPVPAPATTELLKGVPLKSGLVPFETTTPTGAAILASNVDEFTDTMNFTVKKIGYGLGTKTFEIPNLLRVYLIETNDGLQREDQYIIETNIDDMNPELYSYIEEKLFTAGALDVFKTPIIMKKGRPAIKLSILTSIAAEQKIMDILFRETTSIGIRKYAVEKIMLDRDFYTLHTKYGDVTIKRAYYKGTAVQQKAEYEDCLKLSEKNQVPLSHIYNEIYKIIE